MASPLIRWHITQNATDDEAYAILSQDPVWNCFALADLEPPLRNYSQFAIAARDDNAERAICLILRHPIIGQVLSPFGEKEGVEALLKGIELPEQPLLQIQETHLSLLQSYYQAVTSWRPMVRMAITESSFQHQNHTPHPQVKQLTITDLPALQNLYRQHLEGVFSPELFTQGLYIGIYEGENIIAAGGTHAQVPQHRIAVLGQILTAPEARRQGYATAITAALVTSLLAQHFSPIVLNVFEDNSSAIRIYQRLGFQTQHRLFTGKALLIQQKA